jgi:hypothetical protein
VVSAVWLDRSGQRFCCEATDRLQLIVCLKAWVFRPSPYRAVNTLRLGYTNQLVNVV